MSTVQDTVVLSPRPALRGLCGVAYVLGGVANAAVDIIVNCFPNPKQTLLPLTSNANQPQHRDCLQREKAGLDRCSSSKGLAVH
jgi:hypothetical protein